MRRAATATVALTLVGGGGSFSTPSGGAVPGRWATSGAGGSRLAHAIPTTGAARAGATAANEERRRRQVAVASSTGEVRKGKVDGERIWRHLFHRGQVVVFHP